MRTIRIFHPDALTANKSLTLHKQASIHVSQVLRLKINHPLTLFNGDGYNYLSTISAISKSKICVQIVDKQPNTNESKLNTHIALALTKNDKMDIAIQKIVELGVNEITPLLMHHSVIKLDEKKKLKRLQRWSDIIISACEQSGRSILPSLNPVTNWQQWDMSTLPTVKILCDPNSNRSLTDISEPPAQLLLLIGAEGGFSEQEKLACQQAGFIAVSFGHRILRAETAAIATLSAIQMLWGDF